MELTVSHLEKAIHAGNLHVVEYLYNKSNLFSSKSIDLIQLALASSSSDVFRFIIDKVDSLKKESHEKYIRWFILDNTVRSIEDMEIFFKKYDIKIDPGIEFEDMYLDYYLVKRLTAEQATMLLEFMDTESDPWCWISYFQTCAHEYSFQHLAMALIRFKIDINTIFDPDEGTLLDSLEDFSFCFNKEQTTMLRKMGARKAKELKKKHSRRVVHRNA